MNLADRFEDMRYEINDIYGHYKWFGADSYVWVDKSRVIKLCLVSVSSWQVMRLLQRRSGPIARPLEMKIIARDKRYVVGLLTQKLLFRDKSVNESNFHNAEEEFHYEKMKGKIPVEWNDGIDDWRQYDPSYQNFIEGMWIDLARIEFDKPTVKRRDRRINA